VRLYECRRQRRKKVQKIAESLSGGHNLTKAENLAKMKKLQREARQRILERSKVEFRVDPKHVL
jgi:hypothetical protein